MENHWKIRGESLEHHWEIIVFWGIPGYSPAYSRVSAGIVAGPRYPYVSWCILERPGVSWRSPSEPRGNLRRVTKPSRIQETALPVSMYSQVRPEACFDRQVQCFQGVGLHEGNALPTHSNGGNALPTHSNGANMEPKLSSWGSLGRIVGSLGVLMGRLGSLM